MVQGRVTKTPTGYGVIKVAARKQVAISKVATVTVVQNVNVVGRSRGATAAVSGR